MMTELYFEKKTLTGPRLGAPSVFPAMKDAIKTTFHAELGEDDNLFIGYGMLPDPLPYTMLADYETAPEKQDFDGVVLENEFLKALIIPQLGGRLWSLRDKENDRPLLLDNPGFLPGNLGIRNAWPAGGVEWNIGRRGHDAQTCTPRFCARLKMADGTPVLRIYDFNRDRAIPFQLDFFLPGKSKNLFVRVRILNPHDYVVPVYWWSNIAVEEAPGQRIVVPAASSYANSYDGGRHALKEITLPFDDGFDCTYPCNFWDVKDHFYNIPEDSRKYEAVIFADGYGLMHCSTRRLQGRKLFVWGQSPGGRHWQRKLMAPGTPNYIEIQGGICKTQLESMPMPPKTAWEWVETYGAVQVDPKKVFGKWDTAVAAVNEKINRDLPEAVLDDILESTRESMALKPGEIIASGPGWGALEEMRRGAKLTGHLDFGSVQPEQSVWASLLKSGRLENSLPPVSYMVQDEWFELIRKAPRDKWISWYYLGLNYYHRQDFERAGECLRKAVEYEKNPYTLHALAHLHRAAGETAAAADFAVASWKLCPDESFLAKDVLKIVLSAGKYELLRQVYENLVPALQQLQMLRFLYASALAHLGELEAAEKIIGELDPPDVREGENSVSDLYIYIQVSKAKLRGKDLAPARVQVPYQYDLRQVSSNSDYVPPDGCLPE
ncbi:MAG: DUF5107 domain-containing protein [Victivallales bacterium]|nr:DUF5107 domain-containing protein [Victivallales bacterium]